MVFSFRELPEGNFSHFSYFNKKTHNVVFLNCVDNGWFQTGVADFGATHEATLARLQELIDAFEPNHIAFFGFSMGGYGAILYACHLKPDKVVALAPELELNLPFSRSLENLREKPLLGENITQLLSENSHSDFHIIWGDMEPIDLYLATKYRPHIHGRISFIFGCNHYITTFLRNNNQLKPLFNSLVSSEQYSLPEKYRVESIEEFSFDAARVLFDSVNAYKEGKFMDSVERLSVLDMIFQDWAPYWWYLGRTYVKLKNYGMAEHSFRRALDIQADNVYYLFDFANILQLQNNKESAIQILNRLINQPMIGKRAERLLARL